MHRLLAVFAAVAFLAACSDRSTTAPTSRLRPGYASAESDPPPPPLSGAGFGFLDAFGGDASVNTAVATSTSGSAPPLCGSGHSFVLSYDFKYLLTNTSNNEMAHLDLTGDVSGQVTIHDLGNGKSDAHGRVTDAQFAFDIMDGTGSLSASGFLYQISGVLTNLTTGAKCSTPGTLGGSLFEVIP